MPQLEEQRKTSSCPVSGAIKMFAEFVQIKVNCFKGGLRFLKKLLYVSNMESADNLAGTAYTAKSLFCFHVYDSLPGGTSYAANPCSISLSLLQTQEKSLHRSRETYKRQHSWKRNRTGRKTELYTTTYFPSHSGGKKKVFKPCQLTRTCELHNLSKIVSCSLSGFI